MDVEEGLVLQEANGILLSMDHLLHDPLVKVSTLICNFNLSTVGISVLLIGLLRSVLWRDFHFYFYLVNPVSARCF